ncbi:MAG: hypothetical protein ABW224_15180 [Kibdelosporangium sp.]
MARWIVRDGEDTEPTMLAVIEVQPPARTVTVQMLTTDPVAMTPERIEQFRDFLGVAPGLARAGAATFPSTMH